MVISFNLEETKKNPSKNVEIPRHQQTNDILSHEGQGEKSFRSQPGRIPMFPVQMDLHKLTSNIIMAAWKIIFLSKWVICRFHVNLPGCICTFSIDGDI